jgi:DNA invertase Pin-like site-specific DNA recombinase
MEVIKVNLQKHVALYLRVSTQMQQTGLEAQERALLQYCKLNGIENYQLYSDEGISGAKASRPGLDSLMKAVASGEVSSVAVYSFSRFARSTSHLLSALEKFDRAKVTFVSLSEKMDTSSPTGKAIFTIIAAISQLERELISERVKNGLVNARAKGKRIGAPKIHKSTDLIHHLRHQDHSLREIAKLVGCSTATVQRNLKKCI